MGWLCEYIVHLRYIRRKKIGRTRALAARGCANAAPAAMPLPTEAREGCSGALWARPVHASSMVESTADDHLTVDSDANVCAGAKQKVSAVSLGAGGHGHRLQCNSNTQ